MMFLFPGSGPGQAWLTAEIMGSEIMGSEIMGSDHEKNHKSIRLEKKLALKQLNIRVFGSKKGNLTWIRGGVTLQLSALLTWVWET